MVHEDNAVAYYRHLREQDVPHQAASEHAMQRFGLTYAVLMARIGGYVADPEATREALAEARWALKHVDVADETYSIRMTLQDLYNAVTGEDL